jgi:hypothetical protein
LFDNDEQAKLVARYGKELNRIMKKTGDPESARFQKAFKELP